MAPAEGKYFPTQVSGEKVFLLIRRHWIVFFAITFFLFALIIPIIVLLFYWFFAPDTFPGLLGNFVIVFAAAYTLIVLALILYGFINYYLDVYIVTNERIIDIRQHGFFHREIAELHLRQVQDVEAQVNGFFQTLFHYGDIHIQTAGEHENFIFHDVPHPYTLSKKIIELHKAQIDSDRRLAPVEPESDLNTNRKLNTRDDIDDYRPEDYLEETTKDESLSKDDIVSEADARKETLEERADSIEEADGGIKYLEEEYNPETEEKFEKTMEKRDDKLSFGEENLPEEVGFGADNPNLQKDVEKELKEFSEGEEVSLEDDDRDRKI